MAINRRVAAADDLMQSTWLITFADLITLVMCSFIMFFSLSQSSATKVGTQVAHTKEVVELNWSNNELTFKQNDVSRRNGYLTQESIKVVKKLVESKDYKFTALQISVCSGILSEGFASNLVRILEDAGVKRDLIQVRFFGTPCLKVSEDTLSSENEFVGKVTLLH